MNQINIQYYKTKYAEFIIGSYNNKLCLLDFKYRKMRKVVDDRLRSGFGAIFIEQEDDIINETKKQLDKYFDMSIKDFDIPLITVGTEFQKRVWDVLLEVPYGTTLTYLELAKKINNETAIRAVVSANATNSIAIIIPCHRIIASNGDLVGYGGGLALKKRLLKLEKNIFMM